jgi:hypothetical protein
LKPYQLQRRADKFKPHVKDFKASHTRFCPRLSFGPQQTEILNLFLQGVCFFFLIWLSLVQICKSRLDEVSVTYFSSGNREINNWDSFFDTTFFFFFCWENIEH